MSDRPDVGLAGFPRHPAPKPKLRVAEYDIGKDASGRPVTLRRETNSAGVVVWSIKALAVSQRDASGFLGGLSLDNLREIAAVVGVERS